MSWVLLLRFYIVLGTRKLGDNFPSWFTRKGLVSLSCALPSGWMDWPAWLLFLFFFVGLGIAELFEKVFCEVNVVFGKVDR